MIYVYFTSNVTIMVYLVYFLFYLDKSLRLEDNIIMISKFLIIYSSDCFIKYNCGYTNIIVYIYTYDIHSINLKVIQLILIICLLYIAL
jgi:hypothetical protein